MRNGRIDVEEMCVQKEELDDYVGGDGTRAGLVSFETRAAVMFGGVSSPVMAA